MSVDYPGRVEELIGFIRDQYFIEDRQAVEILVSSLLPIPGFTPPWIVIECDWYGFDTGAAWFSFGGAVETSSFPLMRAQRPRTWIDFIRRWIEEKPVRNHFFVESNYKQPMRWINYNVLPPTTHLELIGRSLRLRYKHPKSPAELAFNPGAAGLKKSRLCYLTQSAIDCKFRDPIREVTPPQDYLYWCELGYKLNGQIPWETLINGVGQAAVRRAYLYNRPVEKADWRVSARLLADQVPYWTHLLLRRIEEANRAGHRGAYAETVAKEIGLAPDKVHDLHRRALSQGCLTRYANNSNPVWRVRHQDVIKVAAGHAFGLV